MNRILLTIVLFTLFSIPVLAWNPPFFCRNLDCPIFLSPTNDTHEFETRTYTGGTFVKTCITGRSLVAAQAAGYKRLWSYMNGDNDKNMKIPRTVPILTRIRPSLAHNSYSMLFFLPYAMQENAPTPNDDRVKLVHYNEHLTVAVRSFDGFGVDVLDELQSLQDILEQENTFYNPHTWWYAIYDNLSRTKDRHNEVWLQILGNGKAHQVKTQTTDIIQGKFEQVIEDVKEAVDTIPSTPIEAIFKDLP
jgi:hypothetical protein